ncbi:hypothetical protein EW026_g5749 [Hermanssonia centrifuga]|uniref:Uncharacterized protein n=1 Tax=Hermanssonia centrifuga TaxID=98765 RepID=A0A4S4KDD8_9APHY|nr:hypothetical protein EW026_g5749 [Hermanssonia centrifuga]
MSHWQQPYTVTHPQPYAVTYHRPYAVTHQQHHNWNGHGHGAGGGGKKKPDYMEWMKIGAPIAFHIADIVISGGALSGLLSNVFNGDFFNGLNF